MRTKLKQLTSSMLIWTHDLWSQGSRATFRPSKETDIYVSNCSYNVKNNA